MLRVVLLCRFSLSFAFATFLSVGASGSGPGITTWCRATRGMTGWFLSEFNRSVLPARFPAFAFGFHRQFCRSHPPPPAPAKTRTLASRAVVNKRTCWRVGQSPTFQNRPLRCDCKRSICNDSRAKSGLLITQMITTNSSRNLSFGPRAECGRFAQKCSILRPRLTQETTIGVSP